MRTFTIYPLGNFQIYNTVLLPIVIYCTNNCWRNQMKVGVISPRWWDGEEFEGETTEEVWQWLGRERVQLEHRQGAEVLREEVTGLSACWALVEWNEPWAFVWCWAWACPWALQTQVNVNACNSRLGEISYELCWWGHQGRLPGEGCPGDGLWKLRETWPGGGEWFKDL